MIRFFYSVLLFLSVGLANGQGVMILQDKPFVYKHNRDTAVWNQLINNPTFKTLSTKEQEFFYWNNLMRKSPAGFAETVLKEFLQQFPEANSGDSRSLIADLKQAPGTLPVLLPDQGLIKMASTHATDLKKRGGIISHSSASGKGFVERIKEAGNYRCGAENVFSGSPEALEALILLLIDKGVRDKGHRKNLLSPSFNLMGASLMEVATSKMVLVQDFGCK
jgi:uncharacterized protein YkwD